MSVPNHFELLATDGSARAGRLTTMQQAYAHAIQAGYRFYSYGDACLLFRDKSQ